MKATVADVIFLNSVVCVVATVAGVVIFIVVVVSVKATFEEV